MTDWAKIDETIDIKGLQEDIEQAKGNGTGEYKEVTPGEYEVKIDTMELKLSKSGKPMMSIWFKVLVGEYKGSYIFYNQVVTEGFQIHLANEFLRSLGTQLDIEFKSYEQYNNLILDVFEQTANFEYLLDYSKNAKGFGTFEIEEVYVLE